MPPLHTGRLVIREFSLADAPFVQELVNEPGFLRYIGDRGIRDLAGAEKYLRDGPLASYAQHGFGLWHLALKATGEPVGSCGILQRPFLPDPDLGYALLARFEGQGLAREAAEAAIAHARDGLQRRRLLAITALESPRSIRLLGRLGFVEREVMQFPAYPAPSRVFAREL